MTNLNIRQVAALALFAARMDMADLHRHMIPELFLIWIISVTGELTRRKRMS